MKHMHFTSRNFLMFGVALSLSGFIGVDSAHQLVENGNTFYTEARYQDALSSYQRAALSEPESGVIQFNLGNAYFKQFELGRATEAYKRALLMGDRKIQTLASYNLGNVRYQQSLNAIRTFKDAMRHIKIAIRYYRESLLLDSNFADARYNLELAHRLLEELEQQGIVVQRSPQISDRQSSVGRPGQLDTEMSSPSSSDAEGTNQQSDEMSGQAGEKAPEGNPASSAKSESQPNGSPRDISEEEAAQMAELVRDKALAAESQRQQWKRARMRDTGEAKTW